MNKRICSKCGKEKDISEYGHHKLSKDGIREMCKKCCSEYAKQYREKNKISIIEYRLKNVEKIREYTIKNVEKRKQYYKINKEHITNCNKKWRDKNKEYFENNKEEKTKYDKKYAKEHKDKFIIYTRMRKSKKKQLPSTLTLDQWNQCKEYFDNRCAYCGEEKPLAQEHFIALSNGGGYTIDNIIPSCKSCNSSKYNRIFGEWYAKQYYYSKERELKILEYLLKNKGETK